MGPQVKTTRFDHLNTCTYVLTWVARALEKHTNRTEIGIERRFEALRWLAQDKTTLLVAQFIRNYNRIRRSFNN